MEASERELRVLIRECLWCAFQLVKMKATKEELKEVVKETKRAMELIEELLAREPE